MNALAGGQEIIIHRVVVAGNAAACAMCGTMVMRRPEGLASDRSWASTAKWAAADHARFPAAAP